MIVVSYDTFMNDLEKRLNSEVTLAPIKLFKTVKINVGDERLQEAFTVLDDWVIKWHLKFNMGKCRDACWGKHVSELYI